MAAELRPGAGCARPARREAGTASPACGAAPGSWPGPAAALSWPAGRDGRSYRLDMTGQGPDRQAVSRPAATRTTAPATARTRQPVPLITTLARNPEIGAVPPEPPEPPAVTEPAPVPEPASPFSPELAAAARIAAASETGHSTDTAAPEPSSMSSIPASRRARPRV